uniref:Uncharacterized protein n=1 Tax=Romanomermis culicivorax TaxID=13658 RepID=A0A915IFR2_ROMCU
MRIYTTKYEINDIQKKLKTFTLGESKEKMCRITTSCVSYVYCVSCVKIGFKAHNRQVPACKKSLLQPAEYFQICFEKPIKISLAHVQTSKNFY